VSMSIATRFGIAVSLLCLSATTPALADVTAVARAHSEAFARACAAGDLYEEDAIAVWPGQGDEAKGKAAIGKMSAGLCTSKEKGPGR